MRNFSLLIGYDSHQDYGFDFQMHTFLRKNNSYLHQLKFE